jgi:DNA-binding transcriptional LysR family regulator
MKSGLENIAMFVRVVQERSFTAAGNSLGIGPSGVSKRIARLEKQLGVSLLSRTTRKIVLTGAGQEFFDRCLAGLSEISCAEEILQEHLKTPRGQLRIRVPRGFGRLHIAPLIPKFIATYSEIEVDLTFGNCEEHLLMHFERLTCATPSYLKRYGRPAEFKDLARHNCLIFTASRTPPGEWTYHGRKGIERVRVAGNFRTNSTDAQHNALMEGLGIAHLPSFLIDDEISSGRLEVIFRDADHCERRGPSMKAYFSPAKLRLPKINLFIKFLMKSLG